MNPLNITPSTVLIFWLILARVGGMVMTIPIIGSREVPVQVKIYFSLFLTLIIFPSIIQTQAIPFPKGKEWIIFSLATSKELLLGIILGYITKLLFIGIELAGQIIGFQMGFGIVNVIDPQSETQVNIIGNFKSTLAIIIFLTLNAHYGFLKGIVDSFSQVPLLSFSINPPLIQKITSLVGNIFIISLKIGAPVIVTLLVTQVVMGIISRLVPQMNIFMVSLPLKIGVGLIVISVSLPYFLYFLKGLFFNVYQDIMIILQTAGVR